MNLICGIVKNAIIIGKVKNLIDPPIIIPPHFPLIGGVGQFLLHHVYYILEMSINGSMHSM